MKKILAASFLLLIITLISACAPKQYVWEEEVQLQSGEVITVRRTISFKEYQPAGGGGGSDILNSTLDVISPQHPSNPGTWSHPPFLPLVFDQDPDSHQWYIVATFYMCNTWYEMGRPKLPYAEFHYENGQWTQTPLSEKYIGKDGNMLVPNQADATRNHTLISKRQLMHEPGISARHKRVISTWKPNC